MPLYDAIAPSALLTATVKRTGVPMLAVCGRPTKKPLGRAIGAEVPVIATLPASVTVTVWVPSEWNVMEKLPTPFAIAKFAGSPAWASLLVTRTVPE